MVIGQNKLIVRRFFEAFATNDQAALKEILAPGLQVHLPGEVGPAGRDAFLETVQRWSHAFGELRFTIEHQIAEADSVATRVTLRGTHDQQPFLDVAPSGRTIEVSIVTIERISQSQIEERWVVFDLLGFLHQLEST